MSKQQPMVVTVNEDKKNRKVAVVVEHADWQSFSRAVGPRARKEFKRWVSEHIVFGHLAETGQSLGWFTTLEGRCISIFHYSY